MSTPSDVKPTSTSNKPATTSNRNRQIAYLLVIVLLFMVIFPYTVWLNRVKTEKELGEATIGQVDTGSFMLKLALLGGARGVAANVLWTRAIDLQKMHEWDKLQQTIDMITKLQPHFLAVWTFQGWNLAYNVSVEWDDPADKYEWIKRGIKFIEDGVAKNRKSPDLLWDTAWTYYHKLGFADEAVVLRKLFREDTDEGFKRDPLEQVVRDDNFQLGYSWFTRAVQLVDAGARTLGGMREKDIAPETQVQYVDRPVQHKGRPGDLNFRTMPAHAQTRYAAALEKASIKDHEATFGPVARNEWEKALAEWVKFGDYPFPAFSHPDQEVRIDLITQPEAFAKLTEPQRHWTERWSNDSNYRYWKDRSAAESTRQGVEARRLFYEATIALKAADFPQAITKYKSGLQIWDDLLKSHKDFRGDELSKKDLVFIVRRYVQALRGQNIEITEPPADTPFLDLYKQAAKESIPSDPYDALEVLGRAPKAVDQPAR